MHVASDHGLPRLKGFVETQDLQPNQERGGHCLPPCSMRVASCLFAFFMSGWLKDKRARKCPGRVGGQPQRAGTNARPQNGGYAQNARFFYFGEKKRRRDLKSFLSISLVKPHVPVHDALRNALHSR